MYIFMEQYRKYSSGSRFYLSLGLAVCVSVLTLLHSGRPKLHTILAFLSAIGLNIKYWQTNIIGLFALKIYSLVGNTIKIL